MSGKIIFGVLIVICFFSCGSGRNFNKQKYTKLKKYELQTEEVLFDSEKENYSESISFDQVDEFETLDKLDNKSALTNSVIIDTAYDACQPQVSKEVPEDINQITVDKNFVQLEKNEPEVNSIARSKNNVSSPNKLGNLTHTGTQVLYEFVSFLIASGGVAIVLALGIYGQFAFFLCIVGFIVFLIGVVLMCHFFIKAVKNHRAMKKSEQDKPKIGAKLAMVLAWFLMILIAVAAIPTLIVFGEEVVLSIFY